MLDFECARSAFDALLKKRVVLNAVHRAIVCGNLMENTYRGFLAGFRSGGDMIELDVAATLDGIYYLIHDGMELRVLGSKESVLDSWSADFDTRQYRNTCGSCIGAPERFLDVLPRLLGKGLINVDRSWRYWGSGFLDHLAKLSMFDQLLIKCPADDLPALDALEQSGYPFLFMPMVRKADELRALYARRLNLVAAELLFPTEDSELLHPSLIGELKDRRIAVWMNAITMSNDEWSNISAHHDDDGAVLGDPDAHWGWLIDQGADIIQTDWPTMLYCYLRKRFPESRPELF